MSTGIVPALVVRIADVTLDRLALEQALGTGVARYELAHRGALHYAQMNPPFGEMTWSSVAEWLESIGPRLKKLIERRLIGSVTIDLAVPLPDNAVAHSVTLPAHIALLAGRNLIDVEFSTYLTSSGH